jgi:pyruvate dehydrogenase E1 component beta subunit
MKMRQAVQAALDDELTVVPLGEDIADADGAFNCTERLLGKLGPRRVIDTPISEAGFSEVGVGAATAGLKPVVEMIFIEFIGVGLTGWLPSRHE